MGRQKELTEQEELFCVYFTRIGEPEYGNKTFSAQAAGYASPDSAGCKVFDRPIVQARIKELRDESEYTPDKTMDDIENIKIKAIKKNDLATAVRCSEIQAKALGMLREGINEPDLIKQSDLTEAQRAEGMRYAQWRLSLSNGGEPLTETELQEFRKLLENEERRRAITPKTPPS